MGFQIPAEPTQAYLTDSASFAKYKPAHGYSADQLNAAIVAATAEIQSYCGRKFIASDYDHWIELRNIANKIYLRDFPVNTITSLGYADKVATTETAITEYYINDDRVLPESLTFYRYYKCWIHAVYNAGYITIPADLVQITNELADAIMQGSIVTLTGTETTVKLGPLEKSVKTSADVQKAQQTRVNFQKRLDAWKRKSQ